ncbi:reverse transcriptase domain-containing protein [Tanacetum coccineum]
MSNQTNELKNMMASFFQMNTASSDSGSLPGNTIANQKGKLKAITTRSGLVLDGPSVPMPPPFINPEEDERVEETLTDLELAEYTIKVPPPLVQKAKPPSLRNYVVHQRDLRHPCLLSNKEKLLELANTPLNENCSTVILKKLPEKLGDPGKFLILCGFSELKSKALADLANQSICTPAGIARDVFVPVRKFTFPADFVIVDYESDPRVPLILGRPFLRTARALIDVHGEEMILCDGDERLTLNMRHDTSNYSNQPHKESINMIDFCNVSYEDYLEDLFATNHLSGNPTPILDPIVSSSPTLTSLEESDLIWEEFEAYLASYSFPPGSDDTKFDPEGDLRLIEELLNNDPSSHHPLSRNDDLPFDIEFDLREIEYLLNHDPTKEMDSILEDSIDEGNLADLNNDLIDTIPEMFTDEHTLDYSSPPLYDDVDDDLDFNPPLYELPFHKEVLGSKTLLSFSSENKEKVFNPEILTSKGVHNSLLPELSHRGLSLSKIALDFETSRARGFVLRSLKLQSSASL